VAKISFLVVRVPWGVWRVVEEAEEVEMEVTGVWV
jgi:hypothetical protein